MASTKAKQIGQRHGAAVHNAVGSTVTAVTGTAKDVASYMREFFGTAVRGAAGEQPKRRAKR